MPLLVELIMNSLYGGQIRKDIEESYSCKIEHWMSTEFDERVLDYQEIIYGNCIVRIKDDAEMGDEIKRVITMPLYLGAFVLSNSKQIMNNFIHAIDGFYTNDVFIQTRTVYILKINIGIKKRAGLVGKNRLQCKSDHEEGGIWYGLFLSPKLKYCLTIKKHVVFDEHKTFRGFTNVCDNLDRKEFIKVANGGKLTAKVPFSWKKSNSQGVVIPYIMKNCGECDRLENQKKKFSSKLSDLNQQAPIEFGHMLPEYIII